MPFASPTALFAIPWAVPVIKGSYLEIIRFILPYPLCCSNSPFLLSPVPPTLSPDEENNNKMMSSMTLPNKYNHIRSQENEEESRDATKTRCVWNRCICQLMGQKKRVSNSGGNLMTQEELFGSTQKSVPTAMKDSLEAPINSGIPIEWEVLRISRVVSETLKLGMKDVRWLFMGDDENVFIVQNVVRMLSEDDHRQFYYIRSSSESHVQNIIFTVSKKGLL